MLAVVAFLALTPLAIWAYAGVGNAAAPQGSALALDGNDDYATAPDSPSLDLGTNDDFTIETFVYVPDTNNEATDTLIWKQGAYGVYVLFSTGNADRLIFRLWTGFSSYNFIYADVNLSVGWHHVAAVFDNEVSPTSDLMAIYLDGALVSSSTAFEWTPGIPNSSSALNLGAYVGVNPTAGWMDETRFSNSVRYSGNSYTVPSTPFVSDTNTRALWHFDESPGAIALTDGSPGGNTLTGQNGAAAGLPPGPATPTPTHSPTPTPAPSGKGDIDCDGDVDENDFILLMRFVSGVPAQQPNGCEAIGADTGEGIHGDVTCDDIVDIRDAITVLLFIAGLPTNLTGGCDGP